MDPMKYTMEQLVNALVDQTMGEVDISQPDDNTTMLQTCSESEVLADELYRSLRGVGPNSNKAKEIISSFEDDLVLFYHYPYSHELFNSIEKVIWNKYKDDPKPIIKIVYKAIGSESAREWYENKRQYK